MIIHKVYKKSHFDHFGLPSVKRFGISIWVIDPFWFYISFDDILQQIYLLNMIYLQGEPSLYDDPDMFECLPCAEGCETCQDPRPCVVTLNWVMRIVILILGLINCCILPVIAIFTWKYGHIKVSCEEILLNFCFVLSEKNKSHTTVYGIIICFSKLLNFLFFYRLNIYSC